MPYVIQTSLVAVTGQGRGGSGNSVLQARGDIHLLLTTRWSHWVFCAPATCRGAWKCGSAHDIQWVANTSATTSVARWFQPSWSLPSCWRRQRIQRYHLRTVLTMVCSFNAPFIHSQPLIYSSGNHVNIQKSPSIWHIYNSWQFSLLIPVVILFWSILCQLKIEAYMNKEDIWLGFLVELVPFLTAFNKTYKACILSCITMQLLSLFTSVLAIT